MDKTIEEMTGQELGELRKFVSSAFKVSPKDSQERIAAEVILNWIDERLQSLAHDAGEDCEESECQSCCGEFHGHEFDADEGGYCMCGANGYEEGEL